MKVYVEVAEVYVERSETGCSSVVERALWEREAAGSIPVTPTTILRSNELGATRGTPRNFMFSGEIKDLSNIGEWCNGSTAAFEAVSLGSNPSSPANLIIDRYNKK